MRRDQPKQSATQVRPADEKIKQQHQRQQKAEQAGEAHAYQRDRPFVDPTADAVRHRLRDCSRIHRLTEQIERLVAHDHADEPFNGAAEIRDYGRKPVGERRYAESHDRCRCRDQDDEDRDRDERARQAQ